MNAALSSPEVAREEAQAVLTIDLDALAANWRTLAAIVEPSVCGAVVKADAYGVGVEAAVAALERAGCRIFFVAQLSEARRARRALTREDTYVFLLNGLPADPEAVEVMTSERLSPVLVTLDQWRVWSAAAPQSPAALHVDTGMNRLGLSASDANLIATDGTARNIALVMSHFVASETPDDPMNARQIAAFRDVARAFRGVPLSMANSSGVFLPVRPHFDLVRPGYALYGGNPTPGQTNPMRTVVTLEAPILQVRTIEAGETVGYNAQWTAMRRSRVATIGVGYADGLPRNAMATDMREGGVAVVGGKRCDFAGRVSMDLTVIDVTDVPADAARPGALVQLLGPDIGVDELGARSQTIGYEILTNLGRRYHRRYVGG